ncbi:MAG: T9SS type A sorting domain-containing protein [Ignavibacteriaceae bacterium]|jgi:hypothetical protein
MKMKSLLVFMLLLTGLAIGQVDTIPLVTLQDINFIPDSLNPSTSWPNSPLEGKTVHVRGQVIVSPVINSSTDRRTILSAGARWASYIQENAASPWSGLMILQNDTTIQGTLFDLADTSGTYEFTGVVTPYGQATELILITAPQPIEINLIEQHTKRPDPIVLTLDSCFTAQGTFNYDLRKYLGMYVSFVADADHPIITSDLITGSGSTAGGFNLNDLNGHKIQVYAQSRYFKTGTSYTLRTDYTPPPSGSYLSYVRGLLQAYNNVWEVVPLYPEDMGASIINPPAISNVKRNPAIVGPNDDVTVTASVKSLSGIFPSHVTSVTLFKRVNGGTLDSLPMTKLNTPDSLYSVVIPKVADSAYVEYYVKAYEDHNLASTSPGNIITSRYSYLVLNRPLTIQDVRYSPLGSAYSSYNGYHVTITGVVTADTSDIPGNHGSNPTRVYMQNGNGPWSGILIGTLGMSGTDITKVKRGDNITVEGVISLGSLGVKIDSISPITINSHDNLLPAPQVLLTETVGTSTLGVVAAEQWSSCLVQYQNVTVDSANADGTYNYGESYVNDGVLPHTRVIWSDGNTSFNAGASAVKVNKGDKFSSITGVLGYTHAYYKLTPRKDDDITGYLPTSVKDETAGLPNQYNLKQNYPNPFNPSTNIAYSIPKSGLVTLRIFNVLGQEVRVLVNQMMNPGTYNVSFDASSLTSGVYFYSLSVDNFTQVKKMMLLK